MIGLKSEKMSSTKWKFDQTRSPPRIARASERGSQKDLGLQEKGFEGYGRDGKGRDEVGDVDVDDDAANEACFLRKQAM